MDDQELWQVHIEQGLGPLSLGGSRREVLESLKKFEASMNFDPYGQESELQVKRLGIVLSFGEDGSPILRRIDVTNSRVQFANWDVIGKPIHKAIRLFKCADHETLWCSSYDEASQRALELTLNDQTNLNKPSDAALLRRGTIWIPALGLGFTVNMAQIVTLHVTKPEYAPKFGTGTWNVAQKTMSELGRIPKRDLVTRKETPGANSIRKAMKVALVVTLGIVAWLSIDLQLRWNERPDIPASVIAVTPPPPAPIGDQFQLRFIDETERTNEVTMQRMDFFDEPKLNSIVKIRYLPGSPESPLSDRGLADVGMNYGLPRVAAVVAVYAVLLLLVEVHSWFRARIA